MEHRGLRHGHERFPVRRSRQGIALSSSAFVAGMLELAHNEPALRAHEIPVLLLIGESDPYKYQAKAALRVGSNMRLASKAGRDHSRVSESPVRADHPRILA